MGGFVRQAVDDETLAGCRRGESCAQGRLFEQFSQVVMTLAIRLTGSRPMADEVVQDTFVEVLTKFHQFRGDAPVGAWIRRIAVNKCFAQLRSPWHKRGEELAQEPEGVSFEPGTQMDLEVCMSHLSSTARSVLWLHEVEGFTHQEIGELMGKTPSFSKSQLSRAHKKLNEWVSQELKPRTSSAKKNILDNDIFEGERKCIQLSSS